MSAWFSKKSEKEKIKKKKEFMEEDDDVVYEDEEFKSISPSRRHNGTERNSRSIDHIITSSVINGNNTVIIKSNDCSIKVSILPGKMEIDILDGNAEIKQPQKNTVDLERDLVRAEKTKGLGSGQNYW